MPFRERAGTEEVRPLPERVESRRLSPATSVARLLELISGLSRPWQIALYLALILGVAVGDALTGTQVTFTLLYLVPIFLGAWSLGRRVGRVLALTCAFAYLSADVISRQIGGGPAISLGNRLWNVGIELGVFVWVSSVIASLKEGLESERNARTEAEATLAQLHLAQRTLMQSEKLGAIGRLVAGIAHELNTPLTFILGSLELLESPELDERQRELLARIRRGAQRLVALVEKLLIFSRPSPDLMVRLDPNEVIERSLELCRYNLGTVRLDKSLSPVPEVLGVATLLETALINLIVNALQAMNGKGSLRIASSLEDGAVVIAVSDTGPGISEDVRSVIFEPFATTKAPGHGTGLGLWTARTVVERHMGQIEFTSRLGEGTTFRIRLSPAAARDEGRLGGGLEQEP
jgi:signal transduction histidine kinase